MKKDIARRGWTGLSAILGFVLLASPSPARAETCPSIDFWLEVIRERGGQHRLLNAAELLRSADIFESSADVQRRPWTSGIMTMFPDGSGMVLLNVDTGVCGVIEVPPNHWPMLRRTIVSRST
jgi:hypothetical protein